MGALLITFGIIVTAFLVWFALTRKKDVTFNFKWLGATVFLEAKGDSRSGRKR